MTHQFPHLPASHFVFLQQIVYAVVVDFHVRDENRVNVIGIYGHGSGIVDFSCYHGITVTVTVHHFSPANEPGILPTYIAVNFVKCSRSGRSLDASWCHEASVQLILPVEHCIRITLHIKSIEFVRLEHKFFSLIAGYAIEYHVKASWHYSNVIGFPCHGICLSAACHTISKHQTISAMNQILHQRHGYCSKNISLTNIVSEYSTEGGLNFFLSTISEIHG